MADLDFNPCALANEMQIRTRKAKNFDKVEADLPDPLSPALQLQTVGVGVGVGAWLSRLANLNPFSRAVTGSDIIWLLDNTAYKSSKFGHWEAEFVSAVFEQDAKCKVADIVSGIARVLGLADDAEERRTIEERLMPFLWDIQTSRVFSMVQQGEQLKIGPTSVHGVASNLLKVPSSDAGSLVKGTARVPQGAKGILEMHTYYAGPRGWGVISDVDDTIKVTLTGDPVGILRETFVNEPTPIPGMPELYKDIKSFLPEDTPWFYLSASPYNLYPFLSEFRNRYFPQGTMVLRDSSWKTVAGLLSALTMGTEEYKVDRMKKINSWLPKRKMIVVGDSTQSDPEAYGEL